MNDIKKKLKSLEGAEPSQWKQNAEWRSVNKNWLRRSAFVALKVLEALRAQGLRQIDLAEKLNVSPQQVSKIMQGNENLTLETLDKLERVLGISLLVDSQAQIKTSPGLESKPDIPKD
jgi:ribosome-binding protein aMBF1 (putative translation factor)